MEIRTIVTAPGEQQTFFASLHYARKRRDFLLEPEFYKANGQLPKCPHCEIELITPVWDEIFARVIHYHKSLRTGKHFVCWTGRIPSVDVAKNLFNMWSIGTFYSMLYGEDFAPLWVDCKKIYGNFAYPGFEKLMKQLFSIQLIQPA